jgi:hypothetical protein
LSSASQFAEAVNVYSAAKDRQINDIGARFPGNDKSANIGMWNSKKETKKVVKDVAGKTITEMLDEVAALRVVFCEHPIGLCISRIWWSGSNLDIARDQHWRMRKRVGLR